MMRYFSRKASMLILPQLNKTKDNLKLIRINLNIINNSHIHKLMRPVLRVVLRVIKAYQAAKNL
jgi:hypothetical protein